MYRKTSSSDSKKYLIIGGAVVLAIIIIGAANSIARTSSKPGEKWTCYDSTSYDGNSSNDNRCVSDMGRERYLDDCDAVKLDPDYRPSQKGAARYNGCSR